MCIDSAAGSSDGEVALWSGAGSTSGHDPLAGSMSQGAGLCRLYALLGEGRREREDPRLPPRPVPHSRRRYAYVTRVEGSCHQVGQT